VLDKQVFDALNDSQDGSPLGRRLGGHRATRTAWDDSLSDVLIGAYEDASDRQELLAHLRYCVRELQAAVDAVRQLEESHVPNV
jgi:hypothetical protein